MIGSYGQHTAETGLVKGDAEEDIAASAGGFHDLDPRAKFRDPAAWKEKRQKAIDRYYKMLAARKLAGEQNLEKPGLPGWVLPVAVVSILGLVAFFLFRRRGKKKAGSA